jgi:hypothetical protein
MWNSACNEWALSHWEWADIQVEAKGKNLASQQLFEFWKNSNTTIQSENQSTNMP